MESFSVLTKAVEYIELNLRENISQNDIASHCSYSLSSLQKMFRRTFHIGISDYISRRRITSAARELIGTDRSVLDIALDYGYNSHEVFIRNFTKIWGETPSAFRKKRSFTNIFPRMDMPIVLQEKHEGEVIVMSKRRFDITELYDHLREINDTYVLSFDMVHLMELNDTYGSAAGDLAIAECLKRIDEGKDDDMIMFRIGGDEFILLTETDDIDKARAVGDRILSKNEQTVSYNGTDIPVSMRYGLLKLETNRKLRYGELFTKLIEASRP